MPMVGPWATAAWTVRWSPPAIPAGQVIPPPVPRGTRKFQYIQTKRELPWAYGTWGGLRPAPSYPGGGAVLVPEPELGAMRVVCWWPYAPGVALTRIDSDGKPAAVRGGYPKRVPQRTRKNWCVNPSAAVGLNGWQPGNAGTALSRLTDVDTPRGTAVRATVAAGGQLSVVVPVDFPAGSDSHSAGYHMRFVGGVPTSVTLLVVWNSGALTSTSTAHTSAAVNRSVDRWDRQVAGYTPPQGADAMQARLVVEGMPAGGSMDLSAVTWETGNTTRAYVDGDDLGAAWSGEPGLSTSVAADVVEVLDGECPLDELVRYQVSSPTFAGGRIESEPAWLPSRDQTWLTHPGHPDVPIPVLPASVPDLESAAEQGVFYVLDDTHPIVVSGPRRSPTGSITFGALSVDERRQLRELFASGSPVFLRAPANYDFGGRGIWLSLGDLTEAAGDRRVWSETRLFSAAFTVTRAPATAGLVNPEAFADD